MLVAAQLVAALAAALHVVFFVLESILWTRPRVYARFQVGSAADAQTIRPMAYNQGFYNLVLAIGLFIGIVLLGREGGAGVVGKTLVLFCASAMVVAGAVLVSTGRRYAVAAAIQLVPAAVAVALTVGV